MSIEEIMDWMAYEKSLTDEFRKRQIDKARVAETKEKEAELVKGLFQALRSE